jgi:LysR family transcriptional regulator, benzoate and cis,cis-muconate-responsive activator of ben and cat genes
VALESRQLRYFVAVAQELHFGRAAEKLHMSQPPLSQQIRQLEEQLGVRLFERTKRSVKLTRAGEVFLGQAKSLLGGLEDAVETVRAATRGEAGFLRLGYTAASAYAVVPTLMRRFKERFPQVEVALFERVSNEQTRDLSEGRLDIGLLRPPIDQPSLMTEKLLQERLVVAIPADHVLAKEAVIEASALDGVPFIGFTRDGARYFHDMVEGILAAAQTTPKVVQRATQIHVLVALVSAGLGLAVVPDAAARVLVDGVVYRPLRADHVPRPELHLCWQRAALTPLIGNFLTLAREIARESWD